MDDVYACGFCEKEFSQEDELYAHTQCCETLNQVEEEEDADNQGLCIESIKSEAIEYESSAGEAATEVKDGDSHGCNLCGKTGFSSEKTRDGHVRSCSGMFVRQPKFKAWRASGGVYHCKEPMCTDKTAFESEYSLRIHFYDNHLSEDEKIYECEYCDKRFALRTMRNKHVKVIHEKKYSCDFCGRKFGAKDKLRDHVYTHTGERPYNCDKCDYGTAKKFNLDQHKERKHQDFGIKSHSCEVCGKGFVTQGRLRRHLKVIHRVEESAISPLSSGILDP